MSHLPMLTIDAEFEPLKSDQKMFTKRSKIPKIIQVFGFIDKFETYKTQCRLNRLFVACLETF